MTSAHRARIAGMWLYHHIFVDRECAHKLVLTLPAHGLFCEQLISVDDCGSDAIDATTSWHVRAGLQPGARAAAAVVFVQVSRAQASRRATPQGFGDVRIVCAHHSEAQAVRDALARLKSETLSRRQESAERNGHSLRRLEEFQVDVMLEDECPLRRVEVELRLGTLPRKRSALCMEERIVALCEMSQRELGDADLLLARSQRRFAERQQLQEHAAKFSDQYFSVATTHLLARGEAAAPPHQLPLEY